MADPSASETQYFLRMQRVVDYINANLDDPLDLDTLAEVACLSRFHWHRVFRGLSGETIHATVKRLKLNRASQQLKASTLGLGEIARIAGYSSETAFGRAFKAQMGHSPARFRASPDTAPRPAVLKLERFATRMQTENLDVSIRTLPARRLAVLHNKGAYNGSTVFAKLLRAVLAQSLPCQPIFGLSYDDPSLVPAEDLRTIAGVEIGQNITPDAPLETFEMPPARFAIFNYQGPNERLGLAYSWIFGRWLPATGEMPANLPALNIYFHNPQTTAPEALRTDICIPLLERAPHAS